MKSFIKYLVGFVAGCLMVLIIDKCGGDRNIVKPVIIPVKELKEVISKIEEVADNKVDSLSKIIVTKNKRAKVLLTARILAKAKYEVLQDKLEAYTLEQDTENDYEGGSKETPISIATNLREVAAEKDSLCDASIVEIQTASQIKDSIISINALKYSDLKSTFNIALEQNQILTDYSKKLEKKVKRNKRHTNIIKVAAVITGALLLKNNL